MRLVALALAAGCAHYQPSGPPPPEPLGQSHVPYTGEPEALKPKPLETPLYAARGEAFTTRMRSPTERQKELRGLLADADALLAADQIGALPPILHEIDLLLRPYPDIKAEIDELEDIVVRYDRLKPIELPSAKRRLEDLIDLIRLQLFSAR